MTVKSTRIDTRWPDSWAPRTTNVGQTAANRYAKTRIVQAGIKETSFSVHLDIGDECIPVRHAAPPGPGVEVHARHAERGRDERCSRTSRIGIERLTIDEQFGIKFSGPPASEDLTDKVLVGHKQLSRGAQIGRERRYRGRFRAAPARVQVFARRCSSRAVRTVGILGTLLVR